MNDVYIQKMEERKKGMTLEEFGKYVSDGVDSLEEHYAKKTQTKSLPEPVREQQQFTTSL